MSNIESTRSNFFPKSHEAGKARSKKVNNPFIQRNDPYRKQELDQISSKDAKVTIPEAVRDFSRIKKAVDLAPEIDNSDKIAKLRSQIQGGTYNVDYDALADKILNSEIGA